MPGTLFIVATPIGNLEDLTFRALRTLKEVDVIAAEDTRRTARLLARYEIRKPLVSVHEHNEVRETPKLIARLVAGESIALVSDAGTPGVSDPGARVVRAVRAAQLPVVPIPGPSAVTTALSAVGVSSGQFAFLGFPPSSGKARTEWLASAAAEPRPVVIFEAPHRVRRTVGELICLGITPIYAYRELSKIHETLVICTSIDDARELREAGEYTLVGEPVGKMRVEVDKSAVISDFAVLSGDSDSKPGLAFELLGMRHGISAQEVRKIIKKATISAKQQNRSST